MSLSVDIEKRLGKFVLRARFDTAGGVMGLLGASGCGKSMLLKCIAGIERPDKGRIVLNDRVLFDAKAHIDLPPRQRCVGYLFQNYALFPNMTVRQNILAGLCFEKNHEKREETLREAIRFFHLEGVERHKPHQLSGGQQQRTALARIMVNRPRLLMLDEPFSALDSHLREQLQLQIQELLRTFGRDTIMVTHDRDEAYRLCGRIAVMANGHIETVDTRENVFADPKTVAAAAITGCKNISPARRVDARTLHLETWDADIVLPEDIPEGIDAVGLRAHYFTPVQEPGVNTLPLLDPMRSETPFAVTIVFRAGSGMIRWEMSRDAWQDARLNDLAPYVRIDPRGVVLLRR